MSVAEEVFRRLCAYLGRTATTVCAIHRSPLKDDRGRYTACLDEPRWRCSSPSNSEVISGDDLTRKYCTGRSPTPPSVDAIAKAGSGPDALALIEFKGWRAFVEHNKNKALKRGWETIAQRQAEQFAFEDKKWGTIEVIKGILSEQVAEVKLPKVILVAVTDVDLEIDPAKTLFNDLFVLSETSSTPDFWGIDHEARQAIGKAMDQTLPRGWRLVTCNKLDAFLAGCGA